MSLTDMPHNLDDAPNTCWCGRELDQRDECPAHGDPQEAAECLRAERRMNRMREENL